jgi:hypothetical protein
MRLLLAVLATLAATLAEAQPAGMAAASGAPRYIGSAHLDATRFLAPPPAPGSALQAAELAVVRADQALKDTPRWRQAQSDDDASPFKAFAPVLGRVSRGPPCHGPPRFWTR